VNAILRSMDQDDERKVVEHALDYQLALISNSSMTTESWTEAQKRATEYFQTLFNLLRPWAAKSIDDVAKSQVNDLIDTYRRVIGDPRDPEFRKKLDADIAASRARRAAAKQKGESEQARIERLLRERDARRRHRH
jgi:hypothetical protein